MAVSIEFDKPRTLKFDLAAIRDLERAMDGKPLASIIHDITQLGVTAMVVALWAGLKHEDRGLTVSLTMKLLEHYIADKKSLRRLARNINDAFDETGLFRNEDDDEGNAQPEPATQS